MQKVQRWSQPFCTWTKARVRPAKRLDQMRRGFLDRHDVVDDRLRRIVEIESGARRAQPAPLSFSALPSTRSASAMATKVCGSVCAAQPVTTIFACGPLAAQRPDGLARLTHRLRRHRAGIDHDGVGEAGALRLAADHFRFGGIEPAAEGDDVDAHRHAAPAPANKAASKRPLCSYSTGPVIST